VNPREGMIEKKRKEEKEKKAQQIKHNLLLAAVSKQRGTLDQKAKIQSGSKGDTEDFSEQEVVTRVPAVAVQQTQSLRGRRRVPSRRMQESYNANLQNESIMEEKTMMQKRKYDDDVSTVTSFDSSHGASNHLKVSALEGSERPAAVVVKRSLQEGQQSKLKQRKIGRGKQLIGDKNRYVKQLCHREGCYKFIASHCAGYCMAHFNEINDIQNNVRGPYKTKKTVPPKEKPVSKPTRVLPSRDKPKDVSLEEKGPASPEREIPKRKAKPEFLSLPPPSKKAKQKKPSESHSGGEKPVPSPRSFQNEYGFPTGQKNIDPPAEPAPEYGEGWTTRTLPRISISKGSKNSDTYFYSPLLKFRFRSRIKVEKFLECLKKCDGDEGKAILEFKKVANY